MVIGNQQENMKDMDRKGRRATKLTPEEVSMIQAAPVGCQNELAETFNVSVSQIFRVRRRTNV